MSQALRLNDFVVVLHFANGCLRACLCASATVHIIITRIRTRSHPPQKNRCRCCCLPHACRMRWPTAAAAASAVSTQYKTTPRYVRFASNERCDSPPCLRRRRPTPTTAAEAEEYHLKVVRLCANAAGHARAPVQLVRNLKQFRIESAHRVLDMFTGWDGTLKATQQQHTGRKPPTQHTKKNINTSESSRESTTPSTSYYFCYSLQFV